MPLLNLKRWKSKTSLAVLNENQDTEEIDDKYAYRLLNGLLSNSKYSDVCFGFLFEDENNVVFGHKSILAANCRFFDEMFNKEKKYRYDMDCSPSVFKILVRFIYTGIFRTENMTADELTDLYWLCQNIKYNPLIEILDDYFNQMIISVENVAKFYKIFVWNENEEMIKKCFEVIDYNAERIVTDANIYKEISPDLFRAILKRNTFEVKEIKIFHALHHWSEIHQIDVKSLMKYIRLKYIDRRDFVNIVLPTGLCTVFDYIDVSQESKCERSLFAENSENSDFEISVEIHDEISKYREALNDRKNVNYPILKQN